MFHFNYQALMQKKQFFFQIGTSNNISLIKINKLTSETLVHEKEKHYLKNINDKIVSTTSKISIILILNKN